jgi:hypothetical protein
MQKLAPCVPKISQERVVWAVSERTRAPQLVVEIFLENRQWVAKVIFAWFSVIFLGQRNPVASGCRGKFFFTDRQRVAKRIGNRKIR